jgi:hypothetical protein
LVSNLFLRRQSCDLFAALGRRRRRRKREGEKREKRRERESEA